MSKKRESYVAGAQKEAERAINAGHDQYEVAKHLDAELGKKAGLLRDWARQKWHAERERDARYNKENQR